MPTTTERFGLTDLAVGREIAIDLPVGAYVNLGIGLPQYVAHHVSSNRHVVFHAENGVIGLGGPAAPGEEDPDLIDAGKLPVSLARGGCYVSHADSFALIRGGHLDICVMGGFQVAVSGDLANWSDETSIPAVGGAMDLAVGAKRTVVMMRHNDRSGRPKLVESCSLPLTAAGCVDRVYTDLGIFHVAGDHLLVLGLAEGITHDEVIRRTGGRLAFADDLKRLPRAETDVLAFPRRRAANG